MACSVYVTVLFEAVKFQEHFISMEHRSLGYFAVAFQKCIDVFYSLDFSLLKLLLKSS